MKSFLSLAVCSLLLLSACSNSEEEAAQQKQIQDSLLQVQQDSMTLAFTAELQDIAAVVNEVGTRNGLFDLDSSEGAVLSKDDIINKVKGLDQVLANNQKKLDNIYKNMKSNKVKNTELENMIKAMQESIAKREKEIADLMILLSDKDMEIADIKVRVDSMRKDNIAITEELVQMDQEMHEVYYIVGELKELKEKGVVTKEGGVLGVGGTKKLDVSKMDASLFTSIDERDLVSIPLYSKKAKLITDHPTGSYKLELGAEGNVVALKILDRKSFWKVGDFLVVEVSN